jgi:hypothetical protein
MVDQQADSRTPNRPSGRPSDNFAWVVAPQPQLAGFP